MLYLKDKPKDNWSQLSHDLTTVIYDDGTQEPLRPSHFIITVGKNKGKSLASITDRGYLEWMLSKGDEFTVYIIKKRLQQLV